MPDIHDPAHGPGGGFIPPDGPKGPGGIGPNGEGPDKSEPGHGFLKGRRVTLPPQGEAALKAAEKAHPVAASKVAAKNDEPAPAKLSERTVTPKNGQLHDAEKPSARFLRAKAGEMAAGADKPNDLPKREMQQASAPPLEAGPDADEFSIEEQAAVYNQVARESLNVDAPIDPDNAQPNNGNAEQPKAEAADVDLLATIPFLAGNDNQPPSAPAPADQTPPPSQGDDASIDMDLLATVTQPSKEQDASNPIEFSDIPKANNKVDAQDFEKLIFGGKAYHLDKDNKLCKLSDTSGYDSSMPLVDTTGKGRIFWPKAPSEEARKNVPKEIAHYEDVIIPEHLHKEIFDLVQKFIIDLKKERNKIAIKERAVLHKEVPVHRNNKRGETEKDKFNEDLLVAKREANFDGRKSRLMHHALTAKQNKTDEEEQKTEEQQLTREIASQETKRRIRKEEIDKEELKDEDKRI